MALFTTSGDGSPPSGARRLIWQSGRVLSVPFRLLWWSLGRLARGLVRLFGGGWSWIRRAPRFIDAPLAVVLFAFSVLGPPGPPYSGMPSAATTLLLAAQLLPIAVARSRPVPAALVMASANLVGLFVIDYYPVVSLFALVGVMVIVASRVDLGYDLIRVGLGRTRCQGRHRQEPARRHARRVRRRARTAANHLRGHGRRGVRCRVPRPHAHRAGSRVFRFHR